MRIRKLLCTGAISVCAVFAAGLVKAQSPDSKEYERGFVWFETFQGTSNTLGTVTKLDNSGGYRFGPHFQVKAGLPFYFVHASASSIALGLSSVNGVGDPHLDLQFSLGNSTTSFVSSIRGTAPVGDTEKGLSTGRATVDWSNYLELTAGRISPFLDVGLANSISDTRFFTRPFTSLGKVAQFEGGAYLQLWRALSLGGSLYADAPFGEQKVYSKLVKRGQSAPMGHGRGLGKKNGAFETESVTVGNAEIARDRGGAVWLEAYPGKVAGFQFGFSRSADYDLNSVFFGLLLNVGKLVRDRR